MSKSLRALSVGSNCMLQLEHNTNDTYYTYAFYKGPQRRTKEAIIDYNLRVENGTTTNTCETL